MKKETKWERRLRLFMSLATFLVGLAFIVDSITWINKGNGFETIIGIELLAGGYFILKDKFKGFKLMNQ